LKNGLLNLIGKINMPKKSKDIIAKANGLLCSYDVRKIRNQLNLTQEEAAKLCGGGANAFYRYETGKSLTRRPVSNLLRLLKKHPEDIPYLFKFYPEK
jgi:putative zinc finger/helix-turn-helix YgiT family protein